MGLIYVFKNKINSKIYVGQTVRKFKIRLKEHKNGNQYIDRALRKYGLENFEIYKFYMHEKFLDLFEIQMIKKLCSLDPKGYNLNTGGHKNKKLLEETKEKISESLKGNIPWNKGKKLSKEHIKNRTNSRKGFKHSEKSKKKIRFKSLGRKHSEETKKKISEANKGKKYSKKTIEKMSLAKKGKNHFNYGKNLSKKHKEKIKINQPHSKKVICLETDIIYNSIAETSKKTNVNRISISRCCNGYQKTAYGLHFKFI